VPTWEYAFLTLSKEVDGTQIWGFIGKDGEEEWWTSKEPGGREVGGLLTIEMFNRAGADGWIVSPHGSGGQSSIGYLLRREIDAGPPRGQVVVNDSGLVTPSLA
jgi:hypothetical protein